MTKEQWPTVKLGTLLSPVGVAERITQPEDETFVTLKLHGGGAVPRNIGAGKTPKPFIGFRIRTNQFIYSRIDARNGAFAIVPKALDGAVVSKDFPVFSIGELVESRYLAYFCTTPSFEKLVQVKSSGATNRQRIKEDLFLSLEIPLPPPEEQRRIATILEKANSLRNAPRRTEVHINNIVSQFVENRLLRSNEKFVKLSELCDIQSGITKGRKTKKALAAKIPYLAVSNVKDGYLDLSKVKEIEVTNEEIEKYALHKGDILLTEGGDPDKLGRGCLWNDEIPNCLHQNHIFRVRLKDKQAIPANVLMAILSSKELKSYFLKSAKQTTGIASINRTQLSNAPIPILDNETIAEIDCLLFMCEKLMATNTSRTLLLDELIQSLSARAFTGEL